MLPHPSERYRLFIDETGIQSLKNVHNDPYLCLMGIIVKRGDHDGSISERLRQIKIDLFGHADDSPVILHRREIVRGDPPFDRLHHNPALNAEFEARWLSLIREARYVAIASAIDKRAHIEKYRVWQHDPYHYCLECLIERYVKWLNRNGFVGDVIIEQRGKVPDTRLRRTYRKLYFEGNDHIPRAIAQERLTTNELKFADKTDDVTGIQIADSLAHPTLAYMRTIAISHPIPTTFGQRLVDLLLKHKFVRNPNTHFIPGWGMKMLP